MVGMKYPPIHNTVLSEWFSDHHEFRLLDLYKTKIVRKLNFCTAHMMQPKVTKANLQSWNFQSILLLIPVRFAQIKKKDLLKCKRQITFKSSFFFIQWLSTAALVTGLWVRTTSSQWPTLRSPGRTKRQETTFSNTFYRFKSLHLYSRKKSKFKKDLR